MIVSTPTRPSTPERGAFFSTEKEANPTTKLIIKVQGKKKGGLWDSEITRFIGHFQAAMDMFLHGGCYWFAHILNERFWLKHDTAILYEPVEGHFITRIDGRYYDVRGDVTELYRGHTLYALADMQRENSAMYRHLMRDCRDYMDMDD